MQYTKVTIDLILAVRKNAPQKFKRIIKLSNPDVLMELVNLYNESSNNSLKSLIQRTLVQFDDKKLLDLLQTKEIQSSPAEINKGESQEKVNIDSIPYVASNHISF